MTPDLEDRLAKRFASRATSFRGPGAVILLGLAIVAAVVIFGVTLFPANEVSKTEVAASSDQQSDEVDNRDENKTYTNPDRDRRAEIGPDSDVLAIPATSATGPSSSLENEDEVSLGSGSTTTGSTNAANNSKSEVDSESSTEISTKADQTEQRKEQSSSSQPSSKPTSSQRESKPNPTEAPTTTSKTVPKRPTDAGLASIGNFSYRGAFRLSSEDFGASSTNYAVGTLAYNSANRSLFIAGHTQHNAIAEFTVPAQLGTGSNLATLPVVNKPRQAFSPVLDQVANPDELDRITGMYVLDGGLIVNAENWYDAGGDALDTTLVIPNANDLDGRVTGPYEMNGGAKAAGYMSPVPPEWQGTVGGSILTGWASNYSIVSRYSQGPSVYGMNANAIDPSKPGSIATSVQMVFPDGSPLGANALETKRGAASPTWNFLSRGVYGFIVPGTRTFAVVGSSGGVDSGIGYKITQDDGNLCGGYCSYIAADNYNHYWFFDLDEIAAADNPSSPRPYASGRWSVPFDGNGQHRINGATFDPDSSTLYMSLDEAGQVEAYDRPPVIVAYQIK